MKSLWDRIGEARMAVFYGWTDRVEILFNQSHVVVSGVPGQSPKVEFL